MNMNKKILSLLFLLILLVSVTLSYAFFVQQAPSDGHQTGLEGDIDDDTFTSEVDSLFLDEDEEIEIGEMV